jgi:hypothetical protein
LKTKQNFWNEAKQTQEMAWQISQPAENTGYKRSLGEAKKAGMCL